jgi:hypothetical protein
MSVFHAPCRTLDHVPAFTTWEEGAELWTRLVRALGDTLVSLCLMPDHFHPVTDRPMTDALRRVTSSYTRWLHHRRGGRGALFEPVPTPLVRRTRDKILRDQRYVELNPCRAGLVDDPLGWPLSTWRDRMGLACPPARPRANDPARWHAYATRDDHVAAADLPYRIGVRDPIDVEHAVSAVTRAPLAAMHFRGPARTLLVASLRRLTELPDAAIARITGLSDRQVRRIDPRRVPGVDIVSRVAGDPSFQGLGSGRLDWRDYCAHQRRNSGAPGWRWE